MSQKDLSIAFIKNDLGNIVLKDSKGNDLEGFIRHIEHYLTDFYNFTLKIDEEEFNKTKRVFVYLRAKRNLNKHLNELIEYVNEIFKGREIVVKSIVEEPILIQRNHYFQTNPE